jgi:hypothetical protein
MKKFNPGQLVMTRAVNGMMADNEEFASHVRLSILRHMAGDWGDVCESASYFDPASARRMTHLDKIYTGISSS